MFAKLLAGFVTGFVAGVAWQNGIRYLLVVAVLGGGGGSLSAASSTGATIGLGVLVYFIWRAAKQRTAREAWGRGLISTSYALLFAGASIGFSLIALALGNSRQEDSGLALFIGCAIAGLVVFLIGKNVLKGDSGPSNDIPVSSHSHHEQPETLTANQCAKCGATLVANTKFCAECGASVGGHRSIFSMQRVLPVAAVTSLTTGVAGWFLGYYGMAGYLRKQYHAAIPSWEWFVSQCMQRQRGVCVQTVSGLASMTGFAIAAILMVIAFLFLATRKSPKTALDNGLEITKYVALLVLVMIGTYNAVNGAYGWAAVSLAIAVGVGLLLVVIRRLFGDMPYVHGTQTHAVNTQQNSSSEHEVNAESTAAASHAPLQTVAEPESIVEPARVAPVSRKKIYVAVAIVILLAGIGIAMKMSGDYQTWKQQRIAENERIAMDDPREMAKRIADANERAEQMERQNRAAEEEKKRQEAEARREAELRAQQQQAQQPVAPPVQPAPDLLAKAAQCGDTSACAAIMLEGIDPRKPEVISVAATRISELNKASRGDRKQARALNTKALGELKSNNYAAAIDLLKQAMAVDPADVEVVSNLGYACLQANNYPEAERALIGALLLDPKRTSAWAPYAELFAARGDSNSAVRALLLGYEFSGNRDKTIAVFEDKSSTATREVMRPVFAAALQKIKSSLTQ